MNIIGISAKKQGGKTTAVQGLLPQFRALGHTVEVVSFADALKDLVIEYMLHDDYGVILPSDFDSEEVKNRLHPCGKTYRELLQIVGTDWLRTLWPTIWVENYRHRLSLLSPDSVVLTPDVRFPNEVMAIQGWGGHVVRLLRAPLAGLDQHESETALDSWGTNLRGGLIELGFDAILDNTHMSIPEQHAALWQLVTSKGWVTE